jgi:hypothetical protein
MAACPRARRGQAGRNRAMLPAAVAARQQPAESAA